MRRELNLLGLVAVSGTVTYLSLIPGGGATAGGGGNKLLLHGLAYFGVAAAALVYFQDTRHRPIHAVALAAILGFCIELVQGPMEYRYFSWLDAAANLAGASVVMADRRLGAAARIVELEGRILDAARDLKP